MLKAEKEPTQLCLYQGRSAAGGAGRPGVQFPETALEPAESWEQPI